MARRLKANPERDHTEYFNAIISYFRKAEKTMAHTAIFLVDDKASQKVLAAYTTLTVEWRASRRDPPHDIGRLTSGELLTHLEAGELWDWVWEGVKMDFGGIADRCDLERAEAEQKFEVLRASRLVYPDGTATAVATGILRAEVTKILERIRRQQQVTES